MRRGGHAQGLKERAGRGGHMEMSWILRKVLEGSRTLFMKKQKVKVETLAFAGCGTMHTSDHFGSCGFVLARTPFCGFAIPGVMLRDLAVKKTASLRADTIELEPGRKSGVLETGLLQSICFVSFLEEHWLLIWHVHREPLDVMGTTSKWEFQEAPDCLSRTHIACIHMVLDFIHADLQGGTIVALVAILVKVFHSLDRGDHLDVDVRAILFRKSWIISHHIPVVHDVAVLLDDPTRITPTI